MVLVYRVEHKSNGLGPFRNWDAGVVLEALRHDNDGNCVFAVVGSMGWIAGSETLLTSKHAIPQACPQLTAYLIWDWHVGCLTLDDLAFWIQTDGVRLALDEVGYVVQVWEVSDDYFVGDSVSRQCLFDYMNARRVETLSLLDLPAHNDEQSKKILFALLDGGGEDP